MRFTTLVSIHPYDGALVSGRLRYGANLTASVARRLDPTAGEVPVSVAPRWFGNAHASYDFGASFPTFGLAASVMGKRLADRAIDGNFQPPPYAPPQLRTARHAFWAISFRSAALLSGERELRIFRTKRLTSSVRPSGFFSWLPSDAVSSSSRPVSRDCRVVLRSVFHEGRGAFGVVAMRGANVLRARRILGGAVAGPSAIVAPACADTRPFDVPDRTATGVVLGDTDAGEDAPTLEIDSGVPRLAVLRVPLDTQRCRSWMREEKWRRARLPAPILSAARSSPGAFRDAERTKSSRAASCAERANISIPIRAKGIATLAVVTCAIANCAACGTGVDP